MLHDYESDKAIFERLFTRVPYVVLSAFVRKLAISMEVDPDAAVEMTNEIFIAIEKELKDLTKVDK